MPRNARATHQPRERSERERRPRQSQDRRPAVANAGRRAVAAGAALLAVLVFAAYLPVLRAGFIWDDDDYVTENSTLRSAAGLARIWLEPGAVPQYYPLTFSSLWLEHRLWGLAPLGYHLDNVALHAVNAVLLWLVLRRLEVPGAWAAAAVFGLHPMQVESVAWITERKNVLSGTFALSAALVYLRRVAPGGSAPRSRIAWLPYLAVCALFACALFSKTVTCSLPAVLLLIAWWKDDSIDRRTASLLAPLFAMGMALAAMTVWMERSHVGASGAEWAFSPVDRALIAGRVLWFYPRTLLWPNALTFIYPRWSIDARVWWQHLFPAAAVAAIAALFALRDRVGRGPLAATLCYAGAMVPALGFVNVYPMRFSFVADHFAYLPIVGLIALAAAAGAEIAKRTAPANSRIGLLLGAPILLVLALLTARQCGIYRDVFALWTDTLAKNPSAWIAHNNLGAALVKESRRAEAIPHFEEALRLKPDFPEAHNNFGAALRDLGRLSDATVHWEEAVRLDPNLFDAQNNLGGALFETGRSEEAIAHFERALQSKPEFPEAHNNLGTVLLQLGRRDEAMAHFDAALGLRPDYPEAHYNLGRALVEADRPAPAIDHFRQAIASRPDYRAAINDLAIALIKEGRLEEGIERFREVVRLAPDDRNAADNLERALAMRRASGLEEPGRGR